MILVTGREHLFSRYICDELEGMSLRHVSYNDLHKGGFPVVGKVINEVSPRAVINCFEYSDIEGAEYNDELAYRHNALFVKDLAGVCRENSIYLIHCSTSHVFSGNKGKPYVETDRGDPISVYGDSKYLGEQYILESGTTGCIARFGDIYTSTPMFPYWPYYRAEQDHYMAARGAFISPISAFEAGRAVAALLACKAEGIVHVCCRDAVPSTEFILMVMELLSRHGSALVRDVQERDIQEFFLAADVPWYAVLDSSRYSECAGRPLSAWQQGLEEYININHQAFGALL